MRIVLDLQPYQSGRAPGALATARELALAPGEHEIWVAVSLQYPDPIERIRAELSPVMSAASVVAYEIPPSRGSWSASAAPLIRANFLAGLDPDLVIELNNTDTAADLRARRATGPTPPPLPATVSLARPRLAYVSPLPPQKSGIAYYSAELVPKLARFYEIDLVSEQTEVSDPALAGFALRTPAWFEAHGHEFDRVVYHFGNSGVHRHMFELIRRHSGVAVVHDVYLSHVLSEMERSGYLPQAFLRAMYESHGYTGLQEQRALGREPAIWKFPASQGVLDNASGVIVHSDFARGLVRGWFGPDAAGRCDVIPLLRGKHSDVGRDAARTRLRLAAGDFVICSFGLLGATKRNEELLQAFMDSQLGANAHCLLAFVGENVPNEYGQRVVKRIAASPRGARIRITGFVTPQDYDAYLAACDMAVQLRGNTRGETSAAVLDCLLHGVPTIVNAHGATADLSADLVCKLPDAFTPDELRLALDRLGGDAAWRERLSHAARDFVQSHHAPDRVAQLYADSIERHFTRGHAAHYAALLDALGAIPHDADAADQVAAARAIAFNQRPQWPRQLLVDVSALVRNDLGTGVQRVVRNILLALIASPPSGFRIEPVYSLGAGQAWRYARRFATELVGEPGLRLEDAPAALRPQDVFLGLDLHTRLTADNRVLLRSMRDRGVQLFFTVYDLLPLHMPQAFPAGEAQRFADYLDTITAVSDGIVCISRAVADELLQQLNARPPRRVAPLKIGYFHLGADFASPRAPSSPLAASAPLLAALAARPTLLMVGTVEPRKGHDQALAAMELLWQRGLDLNLVIVGKSGWLVDKLAAKIAGHPQRESRLFWPDPVGDQLLTALYASSAALLAPSLGEGFGLPLIEAAQQDLPLIARDLPVFREVAGEHAYYFTGDTPDALAAAIERWLALRESGVHPMPQGLRGLTWAQSARQLTQAVLEGHWHARWTPPA